MMTLEELNAQAAEDAEFLDGEFDVTEIEEDDEEEFDPDSCLVTCFDMLEDCMRLLGFYGDPQKSKKIKEVDRVIMITKAEEIREFLSDLGELDDEEEEEDKSDARN